MTEEQKDTTRSDKFCWMPGGFTISDPPAKKPRKSRKASKKQPGESEKAERLEEGKEHLADSR